MAEATGSSPVSSTFYSLAGAEVVGAQLPQSLRLVRGAAAAGQDFLVTRRGKPYVRLLPARINWTSTKPPANGSSAGP